VRPLATKRNCYSNSIYAIVTPIRIPNRRTIKDEPLNFDIRNSIEAAACGRLADRPMRLSGSANPCALRGHVANGRAASTLTT
jgi:hypothetical protein